MLVGALLAGGMTIFGMSTVYGVNGGLIGLILNVGICVVGSFLIPAKEEEAARAKRTTQLPA
ncbi:MAG: hypothetical protein ACR2KW_02680 [Rubrobacter sp.]